jgi:hypothetical protein
MNTIIQNILVIITVSLAVAFIIKKFVWKPKKSKQNSCGQDQCGCS